MVANCYDLKLFESHDIYRTTTEQDLEWNVDKTDNSSIVSLFDDSTPQDLQDSDQ